MDLESISLSCTRHRWLFKISFFDHARLPRRTLFLAVVVSEWRQPSKVQYVTISKRFKPLCIIAHIRICTLEKSRKQKITVFSLALCIVSSRGLVFEFGACALHHFRFNMELSCGQNIWGFGYKLFHSKTGYATNNFDLNEFPKLSFNYCRCPINFLNVNFLPHMFWGTAPIM